MHLRCSEDLRRDGIGQSGTGSPAARSSATAPAVSSRLRLLSCFRRCRTSSNSMVSSETVSLSSGTISIPKDWPSTSSTRAIASRIAWSAWPRRRTCEATSRFPTLRATRDHQPASRVAVTAYEVMSTTLDPASRPSSVNTSWPPIHQACGTAFDALRRANSKAPRPNQPKTRRDRPKGADHTVISRGVCNYFANTSWRRERESNPRWRICSPLPYHLAIPPGMPTHKERGATNRSVP
jgi:hypothetical protein